MTIAVIAVIAATAATSATSAAAAAGTPPSEPAPAISQPDDPADKPAEPVPGGGHTDTGDAVPYPARKLPSRAKSSRVAAKRANAATKNTLLPKSKQEGCDMTLDDDPDEDETAALCGVSAADLASIVAKGVEAAARREHAPRGTPAEPAGTAEPAEPAEPLAERLKVRDRHPSRDPSSVSTREPFTRLQRMVCRA